MTKLEIEKLLLTLGFTTDASKKVYSKIYPLCKKTLTVDIDKEKINYDKIGITLGDSTTSNFSQVENFVVLECVDRLLNKGYEPPHLHLERRWQVGHGGSGGKADINVSDRDGNTLLIIECKTWGREYEKYKQKMLNDGAQLFSYLQQDKNTRFLCLYASHVENDHIQYVNAIVPIKDREETLRLLEEGQDVKTYKEAKKKEDHYEVWKENFNCYFAPNGIFDSEVQAYNPEHIPIKKKDLKPFGPDEGSRFYYQFLEILRHNNISDKANAFNRIMSLILCKIVDEKKDDNEITDFQIIEGKDTPEIIQERLQNLYAKGMRDFLKEEIINYTEKDIDDIVGRFPRQKAQKEIKNILRALKFYSNNEFAFKEVHNEKLFLENAKVLNEIINLLQYKKFRYSYNDESESKYQKQYLGNFFELLLDSGYKQDEGQYFTPIPIAKFIVWSLPIKEIIEKKLAQKSANFLPYVIDYACGSGHFLTEMIEELQHTIQDVELKYDETTNREIERVRSGTDWTGEYVYGIEKDYRLARTSKVAMFMHGDGEANIIFGDGLDDYSEKGKSLAAGYDLIVANPPYSVHGFKPHIQKLADKYELYSFLTDTSSEIEALFIERTAQLLNKDGIAGIILPGSILTSNSSIYTGAREIILQNFEIRSIVECGSETFLATETNTLILFVQRRDDRWKEDFRYVAEDFILNNKKRQDDFADTEALFKSYVENLELLFDDYKTVVDRSANEDIKKTEWFKDYETWFQKSTEVVNLKKNNAFKQLQEQDQKDKLTKLFYDRVLQLEYQKFYFYLLAYSQNILLIKTGDNKDVQRAFLGYEKKKGKRDAGLKMYIVDGKHETLLYDEQDKYNEDKTNTVLYQHLIGNRVNVNEQLLPYIEHKSLVDLINFSGQGFDLQISLTGYHKINYREFWKVDEDNLIRLRDFTQLSKGTSITKAQVSDGPYPVIAGGMQPAYYHSAFNQEGNCITVSASGANAGYIAYQKDRIFASDCSVVRSLDENAFNTKVIYLYLKLLQREVFDLQKGAAQPHVYISDIENFKIPNIPISKQKELLDEYKVIEQTENELTKSIDDYYNQINELIKDVYNSHSKVQLRRICTSAQYGLSLSMNTAGKGYRIFRMNEVINGLMVDNGKMKYVNIDATEFAKYKLNKGDILFNRTNSFDLVGKTGIFDLEGDYCYASYLIRVVVDNAKANPWFVNLMMNSDAFQREAKAKAARSVSQANINAQKMQSISIPLPGLTEQDQLAKSAKDLQIKITDAQAQLSLLPEQKENLLRKYISVNEVIQSPKIAVVKTTKKTATTPNLVVEGKAKEKTVSKGKAIKKTGKSKLKNEAKPF